MVRRVPPHQVMRPRLPIRARPAVETSFFALFLVSCPGSFVSRRARPSRLLVAARCSRSAPSRVIARRARRCRSVALLERGPDSPVVGEPRARRAAAHAGRARSMAPTSVGLRSASMVSARSSPEGCAPRRIAKTWRTPLAAAHHVGQHPEHDRVAAITHRAARRKWYDHVRYREAGHLAGPLAAAFHSIAPPTRTGRAPGDIDPLAKKARYPVRPSSAMRHRQGLLCLAEAGCRGGAAVGISPIRSNGGVRSRAVLGE